VLRWEFLSALPRSQTTATPKVEQKPNTIARDTKWNAGIDAEKLFKGKTRKSEEISSLFLIAIVIKGIL
jgi:hypothetical protein